MKTGWEGGWAKQNGRSLVLLGVLAMMLCTLPATYAQSVASATPTTSKSWLHRLLGHSEWSEVERAYDSPREICRLVERNVRYTKERSDTWSPASETWNRGRGDCEDFAILIQELCGLSGLPADVHLYFPAGGKGEGHAVLVGEWNGKMWFSSNGSYEEVKSEKDVRRRVASMLSCKEYQLWDMKLGQGDVARYLERAPARSVAVTER